jgi:hypothetical protein
MSHGSFTDRSQTPSEDEVITSLSKSRALWDDIVLFIESNYRTKKSYKFYGRNYGWALQFSKSGKALVSLYPGQGEFVAQIILNKEQWEEALSLQMGEETRGLINSTPEIHEGKWIFIKINLKIDAEDAKKLISIRANNRTPSGRHSN